MAVVLRMSFIGQTYAKLNFSFGHSSGTDRYMNAILEMTGQRPSVFFKLCWKYITPSLLLVGQKWLVVNQSWKANGRAKSLPSLLLPNAALPVLAFTCWHVEGQGTHQKKLFLFHLAISITCVCVSPFVSALSQISMLLYVIDYQHIKMNDLYVYPDWVYALGVATTLSSVVMVPLWAAGQMVWTAGTCREVSATNKTLFVAAFVRSLSSC